MFSGASNNTIGGGVNTASNVIDANGYYGVSINSNNNLVENDYIGTKPDGSYNVDLINQSAAYSDDGTGNEWQENVYQD